MAITKETIEDKIEVVGDLKAINIREATIIKEDGKVLTTSYNRRTIVPVQSVIDADGKWTHTDTDISKESKDVQGIAKAVWTTDVKKAKRTANEEAVK
jgi:hypothetical protein